MRKKIIFGSLLAAFLMLMIPSISAVEYHTAVEANESRFIDEMQNIDITELKERVKDIDANELRKELKNTDINSVVGKIKEKLNDDNHNPMPTCIITFLLILVAIIATILATISAGIMTLLLNIAQIVFQVLGTIVTTLGKVIMWILDLIIP